MLIGEHGGDPMLAHIAMMQALQRHAPKPVSVKRWQRMSVIGEDRTPRVQRGIDAFDPQRTCSKNQEGLDVPRPSLDNGRYAFVSGVILLRNVSAGIVRHKRRRHKAYDRAGGDVDGNRVAGVISGEKGCRDQGRRTAGNHGGELIAE